MSTRKTRIKAVTSLPPRRKNAVVAENKAMETAEKTTKSPRTPLNKNKALHRENVIESKILERIAQLEKKIEKFSIEKLITTEKPPTVDNSIPSVPESTDDEAMDGIVPLKPASSVPKHMDFLKNEIISENAEVLFDPTMPSPSKVCPKLHPVPRLAPLRRNSVQTAEKTTKSPRTPLNENKALHRENVIESKILERIAQLEKKIEKFSIEKLITTEKPPTVDNSIPSVPESTDDEAMDGIVPLKPAASVPKHMDFVKNEIISENAEVLFDPTMPSPSKVCPKLHPVPRLAPLRRNSVQGSASESEDENQRSLLNSKDPQAHDVHTLQSLPNSDESRASAASPVGEKQPNNKSRRRRKAMRQRLEDAKLEAVTEYDLIHNPTSNPLVLTKDEIILKEAKEEQKAERKAEEKVAAVTPAESPNKSAEAAPAPQIKLGPQGEIILDEQSLVIKQTGSDRKVSSIVHEGALGTDGQYHKLNYCSGAGWTAPETERFYRALAALGTDFTLMMELFPDRTKNQLKNKFKNEKKSNGAQIDKALRGTLQCDVAQLKAEFGEERALAARQAELEREQLHSEMRAERDRRRAARERGLRQSRAAKALESEARVPFHPHVFAEETTVYCVDHFQQIQKPKQTAAQKPPKLAAMKSKQPRSKPKEDTASNRTIPPDVVNNLPLPNSMKPGSMVVIRVNDPASPGKQKLQSYLVIGPGKLTPVPLPSSLSNYMESFKHNSIPIGSNVILPLV